MQTARFNFLFWQRSYAAQLHLIASTLLNVKLNFFGIKLGAAASRIAAHNLPILGPHILPGGARPFFLNFPERTGSDAHFEPSPFKGFRRLLNSVLRARSECDRRLDTDNILIAIHFDEAHVTDQSTI